ncbi:hypothetical protein FIBSPDRAFT_873776, partial [Athelia psychrophila]
EIPRRRRVRVPRKLAHGQVGIPRDQPPYTRQTAVTEATMNFEIAHIQLLCSSSATPASLSHTL